MMNTRSAKNGDAGEMCTQSHVAPRLVRWLCTVGTRARQQLESSPRQLDVELASQQLSVRGRLRREPLSLQVLELIDELQLGMRRGRRRGQPEPEALLPRTRSLAFKRMGFVAALHGADQLPPPPLAEIAFAGRSNAGKSSLLNALSGKGCDKRGTIGIAAVANKPGVTRSINVYANELGAQLVDLPGYGFAFARHEEVAQWQQAMRAYLTSRGAPLRLLLLLDARQSLKHSDRDFLLWLDREARVPLHVVMSKCDLVERKELARRYTVLRREIRELQLRHAVEPHHMISSKTGATADTLTSWCGRSLTLSTPRGRSPVGASTELLLASRCP
jgi:GTP-binding protein